jgi:hypothetical protein
VVSEAVFKRGRNNYAALERLARGQRERDSG